MSGNRHPLFKPLIFVGGLIFGFNHMARPEVVLRFPRFEDLGRPFVMVGAAIVSGVAFALLPRLRNGAPLTGIPDERRPKPLDRNVLVGGAIFGVGRGLSGIRPGAAYASLGIGNVTILRALAGMFVGASGHGYWRSRTRPRGTDAAGAD